MPVNCPGRSRSCTRRGTPCVFDPYRRPHSLPCRPGAARLAASLAACGSASEAARAPPAAATSGTVNWWGWTPTDTATAQRVHRGVQQGVPGHQGQLQAGQRSPTGRPRSGRRSPPASGPDVFDMQPGAYVDRVQVVRRGPDAVAAGGARRRLEVQGRADRGQRPDRGRQAHRHVGRRGLRRHALDQPGHLRQVQPDRRRPRWPSGSTSAQVFKPEPGRLLRAGRRPGGLRPGHAAGDRELGRSPACGPRPRPARPSGTTPASSRRSTIWKQLFTDGIMQPGAVGYQQYPDANNDFLTGKYAMVMMGTWYTQYATDQGDDGGARRGRASPAPSRSRSCRSRSPTSPGAGNTSEMFGDADFGLAVTPSRKDKAAAETFVKWMATSAEGQQVDRRPAQRHARAEGRRAELRHDQARRPGRADSSRCSDLRQRRSAASPSRAFALLSAGRAERDPGRRPRRWRPARRRPQDAADTLQQAAEAAGRDLQVSAVADDAVERPAKA